MVHLSTMVPSSLTLRLLDTGRLGDIGKGTRGGATRRVAQLEREANQSPGDAVRQAAYYQVSLLPRNESIKTLNAGG